MLAAATTNGTWIALTTLIILIIPIYVLTLKAAASYGRLEQKVDSLAASTAAVQQQNAETARIAVVAMAKLSDAFQSHAVQDAQTFGEIKGWMQGVAVPPPKAAPTP